MKINSLHDFVDMSQAELKDLPTDELKQHMDSIDYHLSRPDDYLTDSLHLGLFNTFKVMEKELRARGERL